MGLLAAVGLLTLWLGCSPGPGGTTDERGVYAPANGSVIGELKPAGEDEFLAGDYKAARPLLTEAGRGGSLRAVYFLRIIAERGLDGQAPNPDEANRYVALMGATRKRLEELSTSGPAADRHIYLASLALAYFRGHIEGGQDRARALELSHRAASGGFVPAMNMTAALLIPTGAADQGGILQGMGHIEAFKVSMEAALKNDPIAMGNVGYMYRTGQGVALDVFQGASWARKAAGLPQTTPRVLNDLGAIYEDGLAVTPDKAEARRWYGLAAARGYAMATNNQARLHGGKPGKPEVLEQLEY
jgi:TPR repeat protein